MSLTTFMDNCSLEDYGKSIARYCEQKQRRFNAGIETRAQYKKSFASLARGFANAA